MEFILPYDFFSTPAAISIRQDLKEVSYQETLIWEAYMNEQFQLEDVTLVIDIDQLLNSGSGADALIIFDPIKQPCSKKYYQLILSFEQDYNLPFISINKNLSEFGVIDTDSLKESVKPIDTQILRTLFLENTINNFLPSFQKRQPQLYMIKYTIEAFNQSLKTMIEAPTGTGKTLAYLLPAILFAYYNNEKVVISTFTKHLQHQLLDKDIPLAIKILNLPISYSLMKGKQNYLCLKRFYEFIANQKEDLLLDNSDSSNQSIENIRKWLEKTTTGDLEELPNSDIKNIQENINIQLDLCTHTRCPHIQECFYYQAKQEQEKSHLLVVNHSLLVTQLTLDYHSIPHIVIPEFKHLIIDEAHNFASTSLLELESSYYSLIKPILKIYHFEDKKLNASSQDKNTSFGFLNILARLFHSTLVSPEQKLITDIIQQEIKPLTNRLKQKFDTFFHHLFQVIEKHHLPSANTLRITEENQHDFISLKIVFDDFQESIKYFNHTLGVISSKLIFFPEEFKNQYQTQLKLLTQVPKKLEEEIDIWERLFTPPSSDAAIWLEYQLTNQFVSMHHVQLDNEEFLSQTLYQDKKTILFTSATLTVNNSFQNFKESIGCKLETQEQILPSVFNYTKQAQFMIPDNIPLPDNDHNSESDFYQHSIEFILNCIKIQQGGMLILCTSFKQMNLIYDLLIDSHIESPIFLQNTQSQSVLLEEFKNSKNGILIGVDSFWEGIDIPGQALSLIIMMKLPFKTPSHPIIEAQHEILEKKGLKAFQYLTLPQAVIKFKQGFGRLLRSEKDYGIIICLDTRLIKKPSYGSLFLNSLPVKPIINNTETLLHKIENFFTTHKN